ncbi:hypothetical protein WMY93_014852 [Mugilogobius chulae]|uniref:Ig-like domain-containing protein n=1 Tax=Mugilogobius chulae TaxID=88201 RepID=A0AAW0P5L6_9GOBI
MKLLLSSLQLASLCAISSWSVSSQLVVTQSEDVTVEKGQTVKIFCCWTKGHHRARATWMKNESQVLDSVISEDSCSFLIIPNVTEDHEGKYFCHVRVEIPILIQESGKGTLLTVQSENETSGNQEQDKPHEDSKFPKDATDFILIGLGVLTPILLILLICFCRQRRRRAQAVRVIYESPHFDSETQETQEMDKYSTGSRGSSQWCQVELYEPYFEHVDTKKSG